MDQLMCQKELKKAINSPYLRTGNWNKAKDDLQKGVSLNLRNGTCN